MNLPVYQNIFSKVFDFKRKSVHQKWLNEIHTSNFSCCPFGSRAADIVSARAMPILRILWSELPIWHCIPGIKSWMKSVNKVQTYLCKYIYICTEKLCIEICLNLFCTGLNIFPPKIPYPPELHLFIILWNLTFSDFLLVRLL